MIGSKLGEGREAEVYAWNDDAVVKLYRPGYHGHQAEAAALARLHGRGVAPRLIDVVDRDDRHGVVLERVRGLDMLTVLQRQPWRVLGLARTLAASHLAVHEVHVPEGLPDLRRILAARIEDAILPRRLRGFALRILDRLPAGDRLCHGDYHPGNVLVADRVGVIDWATAARGVPEADHARTIVLLRWADPAPGTTLISRGLMAAGRSVFARAYVRSYRIGSPEPLRQMDGTVALSDRQDRRPEDFLLKIYDGRWDSSDIRDIGDKWRVRSGARLPSDASARPAAERFAALTSPDGSMHQCHLTLRLCTDPNCAGVLAETHPTIVNYGETAADIGDVAVTPGAAYYLVWYQPAPVNGATGVTYWWAGGPAITASDQMQGAAGATIADTPGPTALPPALSHSDRGSTTDR